MNVQPLFTGILVLIAAMSLTNCGKTNDSKDAPSPGTQDQQSIGVDGQEPLPVATESLSVNDSFQMVRSRVLNSSVRESYALFGIRPSIAGLSIIDVTLNGQSLTPSLDGFNGAKILKGTLDTEATNLMFNGPEIGLSAAEKSQMFGGRSGALYFYSENHSFSFSPQNMTTNKVKFIVGSGSKVVGEYEFVLNASRW